MDEAKTRHCLAQVAAYRASGMKASEWARANAVPLRALSSWCTHAARWQARLEGAPAAERGRPAAGFVAARVQGVGIGSCVRVELQAGALAMSLHWPLGHTAELAAWLREVGR